VDIKRGLERFGMKTDDAETIPNGNVYYEVGIRHAVTRGRLPADDVRRENLAVDATRLTPRWTIRQP
jgi:hypothetical protein